MPAEPRPPSERKTRFHDSVRRYVFGLALFPVVPSVSAIGVVALRNLLPTGFDEVRWYHGFLSTLFLAGLILIWRTAVVWSFGRTGLTALISIIPFVQVVWNQPLWNAGCIGVDILRAGQHQLSLGLWVWLSVWVWWGMEKLVAMNDRTTNGTNARSKWLYPLGASLGLFPVLFGSFLIMTMLLETAVNPAQPRLVAGSYLSCALIALPGWCFIWRKWVYWSKSIIGTTGAGFFVLVVIPILTLFFITSLPTFGQVWETTIYCAPLFGWGLWLCWTAWYWPLRGTIGVATTPSCLKCGYSLRGLTGTRCPECGEEPTIDELWAASAGMVT